MAYTKQKFTNGQTLTAEQLTHIEDGIVALNNSVNTLNDSVDALKNNNDVEVDLTGYATEEWVSDSYQPKGDYVRSINGEAPDEHGNINTSPGISGSGYVKSVNGVKPDGAGNVELEIEGIEAKDTTIPYIESLDEANLVNLRDLETGSYVMYGYFIPYSGSSNILTFDNLLVNVVKKTAGTHVLVFSTLNSVVDFLEILVDETAEKGFTYTRTSLNLLEMNALLQSITPAVRVAEITLLAAKWVGDASPYSQVVEINGITERSQVDLTPSVEQLAIFHNKDLAFVTENDDGVVTVYAIGDKPTNDYTMQVTIKEVSV